MGKPNFDKLFEASLLEMHLTFIRSSTGGRPDEKGIPRENQIKRFFKEWLPTKYGVSKGYIIDLAKTVSKECDIVIYDEEMCPKFFFDKELDVRFFPKNEIYGTFEVKSTLNKGELQNSLEKIYSVKSISTGRYGDYSKQNNKWEEKDIKLYKIDKYRNNRNSYVSDDDYEDYKAKIKGDKLNYSDAFAGIIAYKMGKDLTFEELKEKLKKEDAPPEIVLILDKGLLIKTDEETLKRYKALEENKTISSFDRDFDITIQMMQLNSYFGRNPKTDYILLENDKTEVNLMYFYIFVLDFLNRFKKYPYSYASDIISVWKNSNN